MHAQYDEDEQIGDQYSIHRICQAYQLAKFINLATETATSQRDGKDLVILAGDLNIGCDELPFRLLTSMTGLTDSCMHRYSHTIRRSIHGTLDTEVEEDLITCGHRSNSYTVSQSKQVNTSIKDMVLKPTGKRIDFVLYKLLQNATSEAMPYDEQHHMCLADRVHCEGKDPVTGLSFSDHQPVVVKLVVKRKEFMKLQLDHQAQHSAHDIPITKVSGDSNGRSNGCARSASYSDESEESVYEEAIETVSVDTVRNGQSPDARRESNVLMDMLSGPRNGFSETTVTTETKLLIKSKTPQAEAFLRDSHGHLRKYLEGTC